MPEDFLHDDPRSERIRQQERERIARDLHDELGAQLVGLNMALAQVRDALDRDDQTQARRQADYAQTLLEQASSGMHQIIDGLHPPVAQFGLADALAWQTDYPHLLFPVLATEKIQNAANWKRRQQVLLRHHPAYALAA